MGDLSSLLFLSPPVFEAADGLLISLRASLHEVLTLDFCTASGLALVKSHLTWIQGGQFFLSQAGLQSSVADNYDFIPNNKVTLLSSRNGLSEFMDAILCKGGLGSFLSGFCFFEILITIHFLH